ncbi:MAG: hypothetical protein M0R80_25725 [Proteobacteria bacterium]|jgi:hypothetical protein|nr:hypothetical protein [Pseudomonadota bacterium]
MKKHWSQYFMLTVLMLAFASISLNRPIRIFFALPTAEVDTNDTPCSPIPAVNFGNGFITVYQIFPWLWNLPSSFNGPSPDSSMFMIGCMVGVISMIFAVAFYVGIPIHYACKACGFKGFSK